MYRCLVRRMIRPLNVPQALFYKEKPRKRTLKNPRKACPENAERKKVEGEMAEEAEEEEAAEKGPDVTNNKVLRVYFLCVGKLL